MRGAVIVSVPTDPDKLSIFWALFVIVAVVAVIYAVIKAVVDHSAQRQRAEAEQQRLDASVRHSPMTVCPHCAERGNVTVATAANGTTGAYCAHCQNSWSF